MTFPPATDAALRAFENRPTRSEAMTDLARHYHAAGMRETATLFARRGLAARPNGDLLFVESVRRELMHILSIDGYYVTDPEGRRAAAEACDALAFDRDAPLGLRDQARQNYHFYLRPIAEVFPSWSARRLTFTPPDGYVQMAPSVTRHGTRLVAAQRCINYGIDKGGYYQIDGHRRFNEGAIIHTRTLLVEFEPDTMGEFVRGEITMPDFEPVPGACQVHGFEDARLFEWCGELWTISTVLDQNTEGRAEQWLARLPSSLKLTDARPLHAEGLQQPREKNWMPVVEHPGLRFIYACDPTTVLAHNGRVLMREPATMAADHLRGGSQLVPFADGWLAVVHWVVWFDGWPKYRHRLAWFDRDLRLCRVSPGWTFAAHEPELELLKGYEYCTGLCWHPDERRLVVGFQVHEREAWVGTFDARDARRALGIGEEVVRSEDPGRTVVATQGKRCTAAVDKTEASVTTTEASRNTTLRALDDRWVSGQTWVFGQTNHALESIDAIDHAVRALQRADLPLHHSRPKNWDSYLATWHCLDNCAPDGRVLDAGGDRSSVFLPGLSKLGYVDLTSINLEEDRPGTEGGVTYLNADITLACTDAILPVGAFSFIACLSVLEHGVDWRRFFDEAARLLAPGGHLFISVDYWEKPVSTAHVQFLGRWAGQRWEIFTPTTVSEMKTHAQHVGLIPTSAIDLRCANRAVSHLGCDFTFFNMLLRRA